MSIHFFNALNALTGALLHVIRDPLGLTLIKLITTTAVAVKVPILGTLACMTSSDARWSASPDFRT